MPTNTSTLASTEIPLKLPDITQIQKSAVIPLSRVWKRYGPYVVPFLLLFIVVIFLAVLLPLANTASVWLIKVLFDQVLAPHNLGMLLPVCAMYFGVILLSQIMGFADSYLANWIGERFTLKVQSDLYAKINTLPPSVLARLHIGDLLSRLEGDSISIGTLIFTTTINIISSVFSVAFYAAALFYLNWKLALIAMFVAPCMWLVVHLFSQRFRYVALQHRAAEASAQSFAQEGILNSEMVQAYNQQEFSRQRYTSFNWDRVRVRMRNTFLQGLYSSTLQMLVALGAIVMIWFGSQEIISGQLSIGALVAFLGYVGSLYMPLHALSHTGGSIQTSLASADRLEAIWNLNDATGDVPNATTLEAPNGQITFRHINFAYEDGTPVLDNISFSVRSGQVVAIVGPSGSGKTSLVRLLLRMSQPTSGQIVIDGQDIRFVTKESLRQHVAMVFQDPLLFDTTILDNIRFGRPEATEEEVFQAALDANVHEFASTLPQGYYTRIGQRGNLLSAGQRQRIAIARAFVRNAKILVLDEATAALDANSEARVQEALSRLMVGRTTIIIAHHFAAFRLAHRVIVLDHGRIAECGTHDELISEPTLYRSLCLEQEMSVMR